MSTVTRTEAEEWKYAEKALTWYGWGSPVGLVLRFRRSHHIAAHSSANVGIKRSTRKPMILARVLNLKFLTGLAANDRNFKFTAPGAFLIAIGVFLLLIDHAGIIR
jgi:hypothetical protein